MFRVVPLQVDCLQVGLPDAEAPGGAGYLGKEKRVGEVRGAGGGGQDEENKTKHKYEGADPATTMLGSCQARAHGPSRMGAPSSGQAWLRLCLNGRSKSRVPVATAVD